MNNYTIYCLRCMDRKNPAGIDRNPVFSWKLESRENNTIQTACQIRVWENDSEMVWDSGEVLPETANHISYQGKPLKNGTLYTWSVISRNNYGQQAESGKARFLTGIVEDGFWKASWIEPGTARKACTDITDFGAIISGQWKPDGKPEDKLDRPVYFRKDFKTEQSVKRAVIYATAHGIYELQIDGHKVSNFLAPEYTSYKKHLEYQTYDVTEQIRQGSLHAVGFILADGWYSGKIGLMGIGNQYGEQNALLFQMEIEYADDTKETICSDGHMKWNYGGYEYADLFVGEYLDTHKIPRHFSEYGFDETGWMASVVKDYGYANLKGQSVDPVDVVKEIRPALIYTPKGEQVLDAGENICGYTCFAMKTPVNAEIGLEHSEVLDKEGNFLQNIIGQNKDQTDRILTSGEWTEYEPKFTFHGFRYVRVTGIDDIKAEDFKIVVIASSMDRTGEFRCSNEKLNRLQQNIFRSQQGNMVSIPTDCPQRERAGWTGDMQVYAPTAVFNMDTQAFLGRWLYDMRLDQLSDGQIPEVIPQIESSKYVSGNPDTEHISSAGWADACVLVPYALYQAYGDQKILSENYEMMKAWMGYVERNAGEDLCQWGKKFHFGDWLVPSIMAKNRDPMLTAVHTKEEAAMAFFAHTAEKMAEIASVLEKKEDVTYYLALNKRIREAFSKTYVSGDGHMRHRLQGLYVLALHENLLNKRQKTGAIEQLADLIHEAGDCLDTGFLSIPFLLDTLCENGASELAYRLLFQDAAPSWLYALKHDATTLWENWVAILPDGTRTNSSYNHFAFGCVGDFIYRRIGGLRAEKPGYAKIRIDPDYDCGLSWAETIYESVYGKIWIRWEKKEHILLEIKLPPDTSGIVNCGGKEIAVGNGYYRFEL